MCISVSVALGASKSQPPVWKKAKVGTTRIILNSPGVFSKNPNTVPHNVGTTVVSFIQMGETNAYSVTEHYNEEGDFQLAKSADAYLDRSKVRNASTVLIKRDKLTIQGREAIRVDTKCKIQGYTIFLTWIGINDAKYSWVIEAHYPDDIAAKSDAAKLLSSIAISELKNEGGVSSQEYASWSRVKLGNTKITAVAPDLFKLNPSNANLEIEGIKNTISYYCILDNADKNTFNITQGEVIGDYQVAAQQSVERMFTLFSNMSTDCKLVKRTKTKFANKDAIVSELSLKLDGRLYTSTYIVFFDDSFFWIARATALVGPNGQKSLGASRFLSSIEVE